MAIRRANGLFVSSNEVERSLWKVNYKSGAPSQPVLTVDSGTGNLSWTAATGAAGATIGYGVTVFPTGPSVAISGTSGIVTNYSPGITYTFTVWAVNIAGMGIPSIPKTIDIGFNVATGGTVADISDYLGTGETWRTHTFTSSSTLTVTSASLPFDILLVANGGGGGGTRGGAGGGGAGGRVLNSLGVPLSSGDLSVVIGSNTTIPGYTSASGTQAGQATPGATSSVTGTLSNYGGGGGAGGPAGLGTWPNIHTGPAGQNGGAGGGGPGGRGGTDGQSANGWGGGAGSPGTNGLGGGGGGAGGYHANNWNGFTPGGAGGTGRAVISYRIS